ncbi:MAG: hypothetical protein ACD_43C00171G0001 [uncultured bacterium]|nr:MAG: hypothetical protein ACD_43C00171G0001 [uncultured bacterium]
MAVTKTVSIERILKVLQEQSITLIGESRWQEAKEKIAHLPSGIEKHFIGHLQTNKAAEVVAAFDCIETVDSIKLARVINHAAAALNKTMPIFLQVNISDDQAKYGFVPKELEQVVATVKAMPNIRLDGFMTITAQQDKEITRSDFTCMKILQQKFDLKELSMGMSADWKIAAAEGATIVRLGTALFGARILRIDNISIF